MRVIIYKFLGLLDLKIPMIMRRVFNQEMGTLQNNH